MATWLLLVGFYMDLVLSLIVGNLEVGSRPLSRRVPTGVDEVELRCRAGRNVWLLGLDSKARG
ncbi:hypothetical protein N657DRAFT_643982 [Parathielavia appendiculata]|uniref:Uncharacterized protein n=1 Tax=Parathielavia appendiculata TaxID=2587402 RepID=A0AAN6U384_9PEZI|nr:hypothetical protein N657DRAFT_643982 [Parathielavia appendiculata]